MPILPLPQFEADLEADRKAYEALQTPRTLVVRYGVLKLVGEFTNESGAKPGCGSKLVIRTHRGTEIGEMLTSTCPNSGCSKSVTRKQMLEYIENSGGRDYPFSGEGRVLRVVTADDMARQASIEQSRNAMRLEAKRIAEGMRLPIKIVDAEPLLGGERLYFYFNSEDRVDVRELAVELGHRYRVRVELRQVGARDEARITADYERCGQHCCCKNFLKVLKPISMKSAKIQKATLDPLKISGRCGRLMCCLRYEDETYESLRKRLPKKKTRVGTPDGDGTVLDGQILTQLVLVRLDEPEADGTPRDIAVPVESLTDPASATAPVHDEPYPLGPSRDRAGDGRPRQGPMPARPPQDRRNPGENRPESRLGPDARPSPDGRPRSGSPPRPPAPGAGRPPNRDQRSTPPPQGPRPQRAPERGAAPGAPPQGGDLRDDDDRLDEREPGTPLLGGPAAAGPPDDDRPDSEPEDGPDGGLDGVPEGGPDDQDQAALDPDGRSAGPDGPEGSRGTDGSRKKKRRRRRRRRPGQGPEGGAANPGSGSGPGPGPNAGPTA